MLQIPEILLYLEDKLFILGDIDLLERLSNTETFIQNAPGSELEIQETLSWLRDYQHHDFPDLEWEQEGFAEISTINKFLPSKLYGVEGEGRGAKQVNCKPGNRLCGTRCQKIGLNCKYDESYSTLEAKKFSVKEASGLANTMPRTLRNKFVKKFPDVFKDPNKERFLWHLMYSSHSLKDGSILIPKDVMHRFAQDRGGEKFLKGFQEAVGVNPRSGENIFTYTGSSYKYSKAREAKFNLPPSMKKAFKEDLKAGAGDRSTDRVFSVGGMENNKENRELIRQAQKNYALEVSASLKIKEQKIIANYHANQTLKDMPKYHFGRAYKAVEGIDNEDSKLTALRILNNLQNNPIGYYRPSEVTTRMFSANGLQGLKSEVRAALAPSMDEADLVSAHPSMIADLTKNPVLTKVYRDLHENGASVWDKFKNDFETAGYPWDNRTKKAVKIELLALVYGGTRPGAIRRLKDLSKTSPDMGYVAEPKFKDVLFNNEIMHALQEEGDKARKELIVKGKGCNVFGQCFTVDSQKKARSVQSAIIQSYETALVTAMAYPNPDKKETDKDLAWKVIYFAHDGVGIIPKIGHTTEEVRKIMNERLKEKAKSLNMNLVGMEIKPGSLAALEDEGLTDEEIKLLKLEGR